MPTSPSAPTRPGPDPSAPRPADDLRRLWSEGFDEMRPRLRGIRERDVQRRIELLVERFLDGRSELLDLRTAGFPCPPSLARHEDAYRAHRRALDEARTSPAGLLTPELVLAQTACLRHLERGRVRLVLVGGQLDSGAPALAGALGLQHGAVVLRSDEINDAQLLGRAARLLRLGEQVVIDAPWADTARRRAARETASHTSSDLIELWIPADPDGPAAEVSGFDPWPEATIIDPGVGLDQRVGAAAVACGWSG